MHELPSQVQPLQSVPLEPLLLVLLLVLVPEPSIVTIAVWQSSPTKLVSCSGVAPRLAQF